MREVKVIINGALTVMGSLGDKMKKRIVCNLLLLLFAVSILLSGCESMGQVSIDSEKLNEYLEVSQEKAEEMIRDYAGKAKKEIKEQVEKELAKQDGSGGAGILSCVEDVALTDLTGIKSDYAFIYDGNPYLAKYTPDNWEITDSYKITNSRDMAIICQALINEHPIHGRDMVSYRNADDMAYEWEQHNVIYEILSIRIHKSTNGFAEQIRESQPEYSRWIDSVKSVDFDPEDQGKSYEELYEDRTGRKLDIKEILRKAKKLSNY